MDNQTDDVPSCCAIGMLNLNSKLSNRLAAFCVNEAQHVLEQVVTAGITV